MAGAFGKGSGEDCLRDPLGLGLAVTIKNDVDDLIKQCAGSVDLEQLTAKADQFVGGEGGSFGCECVGHLLVRGGVSPDALIIHHRQGMTIAGQFSPIFRNVSQSDAISTLGAAIG